MVKNLALLEESSGLYPYFLGCDLHHTRQEGLGLGQGLTTSDRSLGSASLSRYRVGADHPSEANLGVWDEDVVSCGTSHQSGD